MHAADDAFVSLADLLRPQVVVAEPASGHLDASQDDVAERGETYSDVHAAIGRDVRLFRAQLADAFDAARDAVLRELTYAVLGRELLLAPSDIQTIASRILAEHPLAQPLRIRIAPDDVFAIDAHADSLPTVVCDPSLAPGDAVIELASGTIDAQLGVRLAVLLASVA